MVSKKEKNLLGNRKGFSLIEALVALGIISISMAAFIGMYESMNKANKNLTQKIEKSELGTTLLQSFQEQSLCDSVFTNLEFDESNPSLIPALDLNEVKIGGIEMAKVNNPLPGTQTGLQVEKIQIDEVKKVAGNYYTGNLKIALKPTGVGHVTKPLKLTQLFNTTTGSAPDKRKIASCITPGKMVTVNVVNGNGSGSGGPSGLFDITYAKAGGTPGSPIYTFTLQNGSHNSQVIATDEKGYTVSVGVTDSNGSLIWSGTSSCSSYGKPSPCTLTWVIANGPDTKSLTLNF